MPLYPNALQLIQANLKGIADGTKVSPVAIGILTERQLGAINQARQSRTLPFPVIIAEILFIGQHIYDSRVVRDGYSIDEVLDQIVSALSSHSTFIPTSRIAAIQNPDRRNDRYGNSVQDRAIFECGNHHPRPELFSVVPKGDTPPNGFPSGRKKGRG